MSPPPVRPARPDEGSRLRQLQAQLTEPSPSLLTAALEALSTDPASLPISPAETWRLVVTPDHTDKPVGYLLAVEGTTTHIAELVVAPAHRREKRATTLLESVCGSASQPVTVCVAEPNEAARSLYERCGFVEAARHPGQFDSGDGLTLRYDPK